MDTAFIGVQGNVLAINKETGEALWQTNLGGGFGDSFVSLGTDGVFVFAHSRGSLFCLNAATGEVLWTNDLPGLGYGMASICATAGPTDSQPQIPAQRKKSAGS